MTLHQSAILERRVTTAEDRAQNVRWEAWKATGAQTDARTHFQAKLLAGALLGGCGVLLAIEIIRAMPLVR